jgi:hypothetical protein
LWKSYVFSGVVFDFKYGMEMMAPIESANAQARL